MKIYSNVTDKQYYDGIEKVKKMLKYCQECDSKYADIIFTYVLLLKAQSTNETRKLILNDTIEKFYNLNGEMK